MDRGIVKHTYTSLTLKELEERAQALAQQLAPGDIIALEGPLGAGKTTFSKFIGNALGVPMDSITSPTFTYMHLYEGETTPIAHFDLYRLQHAHQFFSMGFEEYCQPPYLTLIEWPQLIEGQLPYTHWIQLTRSEEA